MDDFRSVVIEVSEKLGLDIYEGLPSCEFTAYRLNPLTRIARPFGFPVGRNLIDISGKLNDLGLVDCYELSARQETPLTKTLDDALLSRLSTAQPCP